MHHRHRECQTNRCRFSERKGLTVFLISLLVEGLGSASTGFTAQLLQMLIFMPGVINQSESAMICEKRKHIPFFSPIQLCNL